MTLNDFEAIMAECRKSYEVNYDAESEHAFIETPGGTISIAFSRKTKRNFVSVAPQTRMSLRNLIQFLTHLHECVDSLGLEEAVSIHMPGSFYYDDEDEFQLTNSVKATVPGHVKKTNESAKPLD